MFWELLNPEAGAIRVGALIKSMLCDDITPDSRRKFITILGGFLDYALKKPNIPGSPGETYTEKYGPMMMTLTRYDLPVHTQDQPRKGSHALRPALCTEWLEWLRTDYVPNHEMPHIAARNYTAIVLQIETGARVSEVLAIKCMGDGCDIDKAKSRVRLFGKAKPYGGKCPRWVTLTPFAAQVLTAFEASFRPMFPQGQTNNLFLTEQGKVLTSRQYRSNFKRIVAWAIDAGIALPADLSAHDLRRTFATNALQSNPLAYRQVLRQLGHKYASSAARYLISTDDDVEESRNDLLDIFIDPHVKDRGE